jgi:hypothetical protein
VQKYKLFYFYQIYFSDFQFFNNRSEQLFDAIFN